MPDTAREWLSRRATAHAWGVAPSSVPAVAAAGGVRVRQLPGLPPKYSAADVARVKAEAEAPAAAAGGVA